MSVLWTLIQAYHAKVKQNRARQALGECSNAGATLQGEEDRIGDMGPGRRLRWVQHRSCTIHIETFT